MGPGSLKSHFLVKSHPEGQRPGDRNRGKECDSGVWAGAEERVFVWERTRGGGLEGEVPWQDAEDDCMRGQ